MVTFEKEGVEQHKLTSIIIGQPKRLCSPRRVKQEFFPVAKPTGELSGLFGGRQCLWTSQ